MSGEQPATVRLRDGLFSDPSDSFGLLPSPCARLFARSAGVVDTAANVDRFLERAELEAGQ